jgi:hypothetical protein
MAAKGLALFDPDDAKNHRHRREVTTWRIWSRSATRTEQELQSALRDATCGFGS